FGAVGLTYDDFLLLPNASDVIPAEADVSTQMTKRLNINVPIISAAIATVTDSPLAIAMTRYGGLGVIHRTLSITNQTSKVDKGKRDESGMITDPVTISPDVTLSQWDDLCARYQISGLPVVDENQILLGIITNRDTRFVPRAEYDTTAVHEI